MKDPHTVEILLDEARGLAENVREGLPDEFDIAMLTTESKLPFKALSYREALIHRFSDLVSGAVDSSFAERPVSAATLTRGSMETLARIWELQQKLSVFEESRGIESLDYFLMSRLFGSRFNADLPQARNVLSCIDKFNKIVPSFRENYDRLSEFVHPNYAGTFQAFAKIDKLELSNFPTWSVVDWLLV